MRELPEPEGFSVDTMFTESRSTANNYSKGAMCPVSEWWDRDQVLAIQKQAYEDGLRDARRMRISSEMLQAGAEEFDGWAKENQGTYECLEAVYLAMLTASQKEQQ